VATDRAGKAPSPWGSERGRWGFFPTKIFKLGRFDPGKDPMIQNSVPDSILLGVCSLGGLAMALDS
jgi:hypothetical protein